MFDEIRFALRTWLFRFCSALPAWLLPGIAGLAADAPAPSALHTAAEVRSLSPAAATERRAIRLEGVVTYYDFSGSFFFVQDETGGACVRVPPSELPLATGQRVLIEGTATTGAFGVAVDRTAIHVLESSTLPAAAPVSVADAFAGRFDLRRIEIEGVVSEYRFLNGRPLFHVHDGNTFIDVLVSDPNLQRDDLANFVDARVRIRGVPAILTRLEGRTRRRQIFVGGRQDISVLQAAPLLPYETSVTPVADVAKSRNSHRIKLRGRVVRSETNMLFIADETGEIGARLQQRSSARPGDLVELLGFGINLPGGPILDHSIERLISRRLGHESILESRPEAASIEFLPLLQTIGEIRRLEPEEAAMGYPVRIKATVTFYDAPWHMLFVQDATNCIFAWLADREQSLQAGQIVEVTGFSAPGLYVPTLVLANARVIAQGELPKPREASHESLLLGEEDSRWVSIEGVVHGMRVEDSHLILEVASPGGRFNAHVAGYTNTQAPVDLIDASVRVHGVCSVIANKRRQAIGFRLFVPRVENIVVTQSAPPSPFTLPQRSIASLFRFDSTGRGGHRVRVVGTVTRQIEGGPGSTFIRDSTGAMQVELQEPLPVRPGDQVEVIGFPTVLDGVPQLRNAILKVTGSLPAAPARAVAIKEALSGDYQADLVTLPARLQEVTETTGSSTLTLQSSGITFEATLPSPLLKLLIAQVPPGSWVQWTGIASADLDAGGDPRSFRLLLHSPADWTVLRRPSWWTIEKALVLAGTMGVLVLAASLWVISLRRRVEYQTGMVRQSLEQEAKLESRYRELFENAHDMVFTTDMEGRLTSFNKAAERLTGYRREQALGLHLNQLLAPGEPILGPTSDPGDPQLSPTICEINFLSRDGLRIPVEVSTTMLLEHGQLAGMQGIARDIAERKHAEEAIQQLNASLEKRVEERTAELRAMNKELDAFSYSVSHDLRAPLRAINGFAEILMKDFGSQLEGKAHHYLNTVAKSGRKMGKLVDDLLAFSRLGRQSINKLPLDLNALVRPVLEELRRQEPGRSVIVKVHPLPAALGDRALVTQLLQNLLSNAWKFTQKTAHAVIEVGASVRDGETVYYVADNGAGFEMQYADKLFGVFQRLHREEEFPGTGVGLAIVHRVIDRHGGRVWAEGKIDNGATFYFTLQSPAIALKP